MWRLETHQCQMRVRYIEGLVFYDDSAMEADELQSSALNLILEREYI